MKKIKNTFLSIIMLLPFLTFAQQTIKGKITDKVTNTELPGVNVVVKGTTNGTSTDFDGLFQLGNVKVGDILVFSFIGYNDLEITLTSLDNLNVQMTESSESLDEVVVIGYGTTTKKDATGSVDVVSAKDFNQGAVVSSDQLLTGKAAGVRITSAGGQPDANPNIRIRSGSSLSANNNPLIVIDGIPIDNVNPAGVNNPLSLVNPNDIESFSILKDASAAAIYGSRASNGVIIITTKKGTSGDVQFNFSTNVSISSVGDSQRLDVMNSSEYVRFIREFHSTRTFTNLAGNEVSITNLLGIDDPTTDVIDDPLTDQIEGRIIANSDWQDQIYRAAVSVNANFSARANLFEKIPSRFSLGYTRNEGVVKTNDYDRYSLSAKLTPKLINDHLKIDINAKTFIAEKNAIDEGGALAGSALMDPTKPIFGDSPNNVNFGGYYQDTRINGDKINLAGQSNPLALLEQRRRPEKVFKILGNIEFDYKMHFLPELRAVLNLGLEASKAKIEETFSDNALATFRSFDGASSLDQSYVFNPGLNYKENQDITNTTLDAYLVYTKELEDRFISNFDVQAGYSYQKFKNDGTKEEYQYNESTGLRELNFDPNNANNRYYNLLNLQSFFGRTNVNFLDKYLVTLSFRTDGSSLFRENKRWGFFPAAAVAWKVKNEKFLKDLEFVNDLKLRIGVGKTGQQDITGIVGYYPSSPLFVIGSNTSQYLPGINLYSAEAYNENLTWEKTTTYNLGVDFGFFDNVISGSFDIFKKNTTDLLANVPVPPGQALTPQFIQNVGETEGEGFELTLNIKPVKTDNFSFDVNTNLAYSRTEVTNLKGLERIPAKDGGLPIGTGVNLAYHQVGIQPFSAWVFKQLYDQNGQPILGAYADLNGDNTITNEDRYFKTLRPNWTFGFALNFVYKNWDLNSSFRGQIGGQVYNAFRMLSADRLEDPDLSRTGLALYNALNFYSTAVNTNLTNNNMNVPFSDYYLEDATFLRCDNVVLGYRFNKFKNSSLKVYVGVNNPFIITKYDGQDPENFNAMDNNFYPRPRTYTFGLNYDF